MENRNIKTFQNNERGIAVLLTVTIISLLFIITFEVNRMIHNSTDIIGSQRDDTELKMMAESGISLAIAVLSKDKKETVSDTLQEDWANSEEMTNMAGLLVFDEGEVALEIIDEMGKIQVNALLSRFPGDLYNHTQRKLWERMLDLIISRDKSEDERNPTEIIESLKDWLDSLDGDSITGFNGAESEYYQEQTPPYKSKNGPIDSLQELMLVKGFSENFFQETKKMDLLKELYQQDFSSEMEDYMTVYGMEKKKKKENRYYYPGKININTATAMILAAVMPAGSEDMASSIEEYRLEKEEETFRHELKGTNWVKQVPGGGDLKLDAALVTDRSDYFRIKSTATKKDKALTITAVIYREADSKGIITCHLLSEKSESGLAGEGDEEVDDEEKPEGEEEEKEEDEEKGDEETRDR